MIVYEKGKMRIVAVVKQVAQGEVETAEDVPVEVRCIPEEKHVDALGSPSWRPIEREALPAYWGLYIVDGQHWLEVEKMGRKIAKRIKEVQEREYWRQHHARKEGQAA